MCTVFRWRFYNEQTCDYERDIYSAVQTQFQRELLMSHPAILFILFCNANIQNTLLMCGTHCKYCTYHSMYSRVGILFPCLCHKRHLHEIILFDLTLSLDYFLLSQRIFFLSLFNIQGSRWFRWFAAQKRHQCRFEILSADQEQ